MDFDEYDAIDEMNQKESRLQRQELLEIIDGLVVKNTRLSIELENSKASIGEIRFKLKESINIINELKNKKE